MTHPIKKRLWKSVVLKELLLPVTKPTLQKRGFYESRLLTEWPHIVGATFAQYSMPQDVIHDRFEREGNKLRLVVDPAWALEVQYMEPVILERIAAYFGYRAIERLVIIQAPVTIDHPTIPKPTEELAPPEDIIQQFSHISDDRLREALIKLATTHRQSRPT